MVLILRKLCELIKEGNDFDAVIEKVHQYMNHTHVSFALSSFDKPIIIILGGLERGQDFNELTSYMSNVKGIIGIGQCRERVLEFGNSLNIPTYIFEHLVDGFDKCYDISDNGDVILLSPASASWDQYKECEVRGAEFKKKVEELKNGNN